MGGLEFCQEYFTKSSSPNNTLYVEIFQRKILCWVDIARLKFKGCVSGISESTTESRSKAIRVFLLRIRRFIRFVSFIFQLFSILIACNCWVLTIRFLPYSFNLSKSESFIRCQWDLWFHMLFSRGERLQSSLNFIKLQTSILTAIYKLKLDQWNENLPRFDQIPVIVFRRNVQ